MTTSYKLPTDTPITFYIHVRNTDYIPRFAISHNFRIYSPDGATWNTLTADTLDFGWGTWGQMFDMTGVTIDYRSIDGIWDDTVVFWGVAWEWGMPGYFDESSYSITIGPINNTMDGKTICLDSASFPPAGEWIWSDEAGNTSIPPWGGPYCYTIEKAGTISYSGHLYCLDPVPPDTNQMPMRRIKIEMWDDDQWPIPDQLLDSTTTDECGYFSLGPVENNDDWGVATQDIFFRIYAMNEAAYVTVDYNDDIHMIQTPVQNDIPSGDYDTAIVANLESSGPFFIVDAVMEARDSWFYLTDFDVGIVQVVSKIGDSTYYDPSNKYISIGNNAANIDTYDKDIIFHEYGHRIQDIYNFFNTGAGYHEWAGIEIPTIAATEGSATFLSCVFRNDKICRDYYNDFVDTYWLNAENGCWGVNGDRHGSANNYGVACEGAVCGIIWDIYDNADDDYSTFSFPAPPDPNDSNPDGIWDTLSVGSSSILDVLLLRNIDGYPPRDIIEFWKAWFQEPSKGHPKAMRDIWYEHGILTCGDVNGDNQIDVGDVVFLINYVFHDGPAPDPFDWGNVNGDSLVNVGDIVYLVSYVFKGGLPPCA